LEAATSRGAAAGTEMPSVGDHEVLRVTTDRARAPAAAAAPRAWDLGAEEDLVAAVVAVEAAAVEAVGGAGKRPKSRKGNYRTQI
jgi:hypothetical protein